MELDAAEGADILMVKPAITSLDLLGQGRGSASSCRSRPTRSAASSR